MNQYNQDQSAQDNSAPASQTEAAGIFLKYHGLVRSLAFRMAPVKHLQEDIVQDVFVEFVSKSENWEMGDRIAGLLVKITRTVALNHWKIHIRNLPENLGEIAKSIQKESTASLPDNGQWSEDSDEIVSALEKCLESLTPKSRALVESHYRKGTSCVDLAEASSQKEATIRQRLCRIRAVLRDCINRRRGKDQK